MTATTKEQPFDQARAALLESQSRVNRAPLCCCDGIETAHEIKPSRIPWGIVITAIISLGIIACIFGYANRKPANAAERERPHAIVLLMKPTAIDWAAANEQRNQFTLSNAFPDRSACERAKQRLVVMAKGGTVQCLPAYRSN